MALGKHVSIFAVTFLRNHFTLKQTISNARAYNIVLNNYELRCKNYMNIQNQSPQDALMSAKEQELILVVKRSLFFPDGDFQGIEQNVWPYIERISAHKEFLPRGFMEQNPAYKQIIPYQVFMYEDKIFLMQRHAKASEERLRNKMTIGIGGHVREEDIRSGNLYEWASREFHEEVCYSGSITVKPLGILNDDSNEVGRVHAGFIFLLKGDSPDISVHSELQSGMLVTMEECSTYYDSLETWSQMVFDALRAV